MNREGNEINDNNFWGKGSKMFPLISKVVLLGRCEREDPKFVLYGCQNVSSWDLLSSHEKVIYSGYRKGREMCVIKPLLLNYQVLLNKI